MVSLPPTRSNSFSCRKPQQLHLDGRRDVADLVEEQRPVVRLLEAARPRARPRP
jgi:hypothetical protein